MGKTFQRDTIGYGVFAGMRNLAAALLFTTGLGYAEPLTLVAFGDSLTAGYGLPPADGFVPQMQAWLTANGADVTVVNAGVSGDTTSGGLSRIEWTLTPEVDAMIVALGGNDYLRGLDPALARANINAILETSQMRDIDVLLVGHQVGGNFGPDYAAAFNALYPDLATTYDVPLFPTWFAGLAAQGDSSDGFRAFMQADRIHPNAQGVKLIVEAMGPAVLDLLQDN